MTFTIWVDADSCPRKAREIAAKCAARTGMPLVLVANRAIPHDAGNTSVRMVVVPQEQDGADNYIVEHAAQDDIVITRDIPFAARLVEKGICAINDRGTSFTTDNIGELLSERNYSVQLAQLGLSNGGFGSYSKQDVYRFANCLDRLVTKKRQQ